MAFKKKLALFIAEYEHQITEIQKIYDMLEQKIATEESKEVSMEIVESTGYWLHNLYCAFEDLFKLVAGFWENDVDTKNGYHIHLLKRMQLKIKGIRPALLSEDSYESLNELRGFRHVFRHAYSYGLDDQRVFGLLRQVLNKKNVVINDLHKFRTEIESLE